MTDLDVFALPSYESARLPDAWPYIISFLSRRDLVRLSLVSRKFRGIAQGSLWSEPRNQWDQADANMVDELHRFMEALTVSQRSSIKPHLYVQTLDLSYLGSDSLTYAFTNGWASRLLSQLSSLCSFVVSHTDAFDHGSIDTGMRDCGRLRLLSIVSCQNLTPQALKRLLKSAPNLYYLEVSECPRARGSQIIESISELSKLGVLKLARSGYTDDDIVNFARSVIASRADPNNPLPQNVRSLDIGHNGLTDAIIDGLKFLGEALPSNDEPPPYDVDNLDDIESSALISSPDNGWSSFFESRTPDQNACNRFNDARDNVITEVQSPGFRSPVEAGDLGNGITHLYLNGNALSTAAMTAFLRALPLEDLDCDNLRSTQSAGGADGNAIPGAILAARAILDAVIDCPTLKRLRVDHKLVTGFIGSELKEPLETDDTTDLPPYPYSWLRHQGTQWDPMVLQGHSVKMFQFSPAILALDSLTLTSMLQDTVSKDFVKCMQAFINAAGDMQSMAQQYQTLKTSQSKHSAMLSALQEIRLELVSSNYSHDVYDEDTKAYEEASQGDFSFFPDEKDAYVSTSQLQRLSIEDRSKSAGTQTLFDMVTELGSFRRQQRYDTTEDRPDSEKTTSVWKGRLAIVRKASP